MLIWLDDLIMGSILIVFDDYGFEVVESDDYGFDVEGSGFDVDWIR